MNKIKKMKTLREVICDYSVERLLSCLQKDIHVEVPITKKVFELVCDRLLDSKDFDNLKKFVNNYQIKKLEN